MEAIILSKMSETLKDNYHISFICEIQVFKNKDMKVEQSWLHGGYPAEKEQVREGIEFHQSSLYADVKTQGNPLLYKNNVCSFN